MFLTKRVVRLSETDATGAIYFTNILKYATETFEEFLGASIFEENYLLPIVSAKATFLKPLFMGNEVVLQLISSKMGTTSIKLQTEIYIGDVLVCKVEVIHVATSKSEGKKIPIPPLLREYLSCLEL